MKIRKAFQMTLLPSCHLEYESRHNPIWKELADVLKEHGVSNYSIFLSPDGCLLFGYAELESEELWTQIAHTPVCRKWWRHMSDIMITNTDLSPISTPLKQVFHLP